MNTAQTRLAVAELTATLTTDFDVPTLLHAVAQHARTCFDAVSAVVILLDGRRSEEPGLHIVAEAMRDDIIADPRLHITGPGLSSARDGAVAMIDDLAEEDGEDPRWESYRKWARAAGVRSVRAFPVTALAVPLGSVVVHADEPWGTERPNDFGQVLADLIAIALSIGTLDGRVAATEETVRAVLRGTSVVSTAVGILAEYFDLDIEAARARRLHLARAHQTTPTAHAAAICAAHNSSPDDPGRSPALHPPPDITPPTHIY
ncbi:GAF domain-containing protein [Nocardia cyriacigeorgica]|uniref:GAF domain-containing protein n=1 Tax=Nocardia cyriacigeorgica TaxID=135487 RepID=A0A5R8NQ06_9NOCA|nr:GAF domain-containing protein [Nocardia cyriacigeorgica]TLF76747.1 GAF domain-containing protein [Nocardia cyriacigeorgica]